MTTQDSQVKLVVTDVDNTLFDWVAIWHASFSALLDGILAVSELPREQVVREIRGVHQRVGTSEYAFLLQDLPSLRLTGESDVLATPYATAVSAFRAARADAIRLYPGVRETLLELNRLGIPVVCYTESVTFYTVLRFRWLELDGLIQVLYSPQDHSKPEQVELDKVRRSPSFSYNLVHTAHRLTPEGHFKPEPVVLESIIREFDVEPGAVAYIGDSLSKDVAMAQHVGAIDLHARYGLVQDKPEYRLLREVSHWTDEDVEREKELLRRPEVEASIVLDCFADLLSKLRIT